MTFQKGGFSCPLGMLKEKKKVRAGGCDQTAAPAITYGASREAGNSQLWYGSGDEGRTSDQSLIALL